GDLALAHPEGTDGHEVLRTLVCRSAGFAVRAAHDKGAARNGHHVELHRGTGYGFRVGLEFEPGCVSPGSSSRRAFGDRRAELEACRGYCGQQTTACRIL